jgi:hypothetical protein
MPTRPPGSPFVVFDVDISLKFDGWLVVSTPPKNISQLGRIIPNI